MDEHEDVLVAEESEKGIVSDDIVEIVRAVEAAYDVSAQNIRVFKGEYDRNIRFDDPKLGTWLIKVSSADIGELTIQWQESLLNAAAADDRVPFRTPRLLPSLDGRTHITIDSRYGTYIARIVSWIQGPLMSEVTGFGPQLLTSLGEASAHLTRALSGVTVPNGIVDHRWLIQRGPEVVDCAVALLRDDGRVKIVRELSRRFNDNVLPRLGQLPWAVIHHDLHDANVILDIGTQTVRGVIDFNDAVYAPRISDLAIAGAYAMLRQDEPEHSFREVVTGYRSVAEPTSEELELVGEMALMRLCMNWSQWQARALHSTDSEYALTRSQFTWPLIEHLAEVGPPTV